MRARTPAGARLQETRTTMDDPRGDYDSHNRRMHRQPPQNHAGYGPPSQQQPQGGSSSNIPVMPGTVPTHRNLEDDSNHSSSHHPRDSSGRGLARATSAMPSERSLMGGDSMMEEPRMTDQPGGRRQSRHDIMMDVPPAHASRSQTTPPSSCAVPLGMSAMNRTLENSNRTYSTTPSSNNSHGLGNRSLEESDAPPAAPYRNLMSSPSSNHTASIGASRNNTDNAEIAFPTPDPAVARARTSMTHMHQQHRTSTTSTGPSKALPPPKAGRPPPPDLKAIEPALPSTRLGRRCLTNRPPREADFAKGDQGEVRVSCVTCGAVLRIPAAAIVVQCSQCRTAHPTATCPVLKSS